MAEQRKFYVVWVGREPGIYDNWDDCRMQVEMYPGAKYKSFTSQTEATLAFRGDLEDQEAIVRAIADHNAQSGGGVANGAARLDELKARFPEINGNAIAVDGACAGNPGMMEYRGVDMSTGKQIFHFGPMAGGTNNVAEYLALVHALALLYNRCDSTTPIYTDSRTARSWVRNRGNRCTLPHNVVTAPVWGLLKRADAWVQSHNTSTAVLVWDTSRWGEIPADFGRK